MNQLDLEGKNKLEITLDRIRSFEPPEGYWLAFSGGKDSVCLLHLAKLAGVKFQAHYNSTTIDPPELVRFVKTFPEVAIDRPRRSFFALVRKWGLPMRQSRWCCLELKERGGIGRIVLLGIRWAEGGARRRRRLVENCRRHPGKRFVNPIIDWTDKDIWDFIRAEKLRYCSLYDEGFKRLGCVLCPFERNVKRSMLRWPKMWAQAKRALQQRWQGPTGRGKSDKFESAEDFWQWWIARDQPYPSEEEETAKQLCLMGLGGQE